MRNFIKSISIILSVICVCIFGICIESRNSYPNEITSYNNENISFNNFITITFNNQSKKEIKVNSELTEKNANRELMLMNIIPIKSVNVHNQPKKFVVPCGTLFGIKFHTKGVCVISCNQVDDSQNKINPGKEAGLEAGDTIININGNSIQSCDDVRQIVEQSSGSTLEIRYDRHGESKSTSIKPVMSDDGYKIGLWIKDSCAGLGTMTFYDPDSGAFASLGHGICDSDTGELLLLESAEITPAKISSITKGSNGIPGSINGYFSSDDSIGNAVVNNNMGLYGKLNCDISQFEPIEVAAIQDIHKGKAQILCTLDNESPKYYNIEITDVNYDEKNKTKNLQILATDNRLLEKSGGIIQGMSGSPILQNGKLVGAVTHVLITNSAKGYGIFAQNMIQQIDNNQILSFNNY